MRRTRDEHKKSFCDESEAYPLIARLPDEVRAPQRAGTGVPPRRCMPSRDDRGSLDPTPGILTVSICCMHDGRTARVVGTTASLPTTVREGRRILLRDRVRPGAGRILPGWSRCVAPASSRLRNGADPPSVGGLTRICSDRATSRNSLSQHAGGGRAQRACRCIASWRRDSFEPCRLAGEARVPFPLGRDGELEVVYAAHQGLVRSVPC